MGDKEIILIADYPAADEDTIVYVENSIFYECLLDVCKTYMAKQLIGNEMDTKKAPISISII